MKESDILIGVLGKTLKKSPDELRDLIYQNDEISETAVENILNADAERVKRIRKDAETDGFNNGHKKGLAETMSGFEQDLKARYSIKSETQGNDLVEEIILKHQKTNLGEDDVKKHPAFLQLEKGTVRKEDYNRLMTEFETFKTNLDREKVLDRVRNKALEELNKLNPVIEDNPVVAENRRKMFLKEFEAFDYEFEDDYIMPVKDGKRVQDKHGNPVGFSSYVRQVAERNFVLAQQQLRQSAGNNKSGSTMTINIPRNDSEYIKAITNEKDPEKRVAIKKAFEQSQKEI